MSFSHIQDGRARMVDIGAKPTCCGAVAAGEIRLKRETLELIKNRKIVKGEVLETARIAAVMAVKRTALSIPCATISR